MVNVPIFFGAIVKDKYVQANYYASHRDQDFTDICSKLSEKPKSINDFVWQRSDDIFFHSYHKYIEDSLFSFICAMQDNNNKEMAEEFLTKLMKLFENTYGKAKEGFNTDAYYSKTIRKYLQQLQEDYKKQYNINQIENQIEKITQEAQSNLNTLINQTGKTESILQKTEKLEDFGDVIAMKSKQLKNKFFWRRYRVQFLFIILFVCMYLTYYYILR